MREILLLQPVCERKQVTCCVCHHSDNFTQAITSRRYRGQYYPCASYFANDRATRTSSNWSKCMMLSAWAARAIIDTVLCSSISCTKLILQRTLRFTMLSLFESREISYPNHSCLQGATSVPSRSPTSPASYDPHF